MIRVFIAAPIRRILRHSRHARSIADGLSLGRCVTFSFRVPSMPRASVSRIDRRSARGLELRRNCPPAGETFLRRRSQYSLAFHAYSTQCTLQNAKASYDFSSNDPFPYPRYTDDWFNSHGTRYANEEAIKLFVFVMQCVLGRHAHGGMGVCKN
jgi:hypothetical protein